MDQFKSVFRKRQAMWDDMVMKKEKLLEEQIKKHEEIRDASIPEVKQFYAGESILVTGGTGFVGKVLIEKLLRSVPDLKKIYMVIRTKKNQSPADRLATVLSSDLFDLLRNDRPDALNKVVAIAGDMSAMGLGLSAEDKSLLQEEVMVVFHVAASVRFDDPLQEAVLLNTRGTHELVELSKGMKNLKCFLHVSTTYCNTNHSPTMERVYPTPFNWQYIVKLAETNPLGDIQALTPKILGFQPNTYTFTKQLSEKVIDDARHEIPVMIFRPSVVQGTDSEPFQGWTDQLYGITVFGVGMLKGIVRMMYVDQTVHLNLVTVDAVAKAMVLCAWVRGTNQRLSEDASDTDVVNVTGDELCDGTYGDLVTGLDHLAEIVQPKCLRAPRISLTTSWLWFHYHIFTSQIVFAVLGDIFLRLSGLKPRLLKLSRVIYKSNMSLSYFQFRNFFNTTENQWGCASFNSDPDFHPKLKINFAEVYASQMKYVFRNIMKEEQGSPRHRKMFLNAVAFCVEPLRCALKCPLMPGDVLYASHMVNMPFVNEYCYTVSISETGSVVTTNYQGDCTCKSVSRFYFYKCWDTGRLVDNEL